MAFVQAQSLSTPVASGVAGSSATGVVGGHGLVCFVLYNVTATSLSLSDSSGTTWGLWKSIALTGATIAVFHTTSAVGAGTHTVTPSWTGGGTAWTSLIEDDQSPTAGVPVGQKLTAPGAGNTLVAGANIGITGSSCYMLAVDTTNKTGTTFCPGIGAFNTNVWSTNDTGIGSWTLCPSTTVGGTNAGMSPGPSDSTGADNYAVLAMGFQPSGAAIPGPTNQVVLFDEDVGPVRRTPYPLGMFFNRNTFQPPNTPLAYMSVKTPPWEFYRDPFTSVYPVLELYSQIPVTPSKRQFFLFPKTGRLDPPEEDIQRANHSAYFMLARHYTAQMVGYTVETPDLNDHPWLEWVHPKLDDETAIFPYRRIPVITPPGPNAIFWGQPKPWWVAGEEDSVFRHPPSLDILIPFPRPIPPSIIMPDLTGLLEKDAIAAILALNLLYLDSVYQDVVYPLLTPNRYNPIGPEPPPPAGIVIDQRPAPGTVVQPLLTEVILIVSTGRSFISDVGPSSGNIPNTVIGNNSGP